MKPCKEMLDKIEWDQKENKDLYTVHYKHNSKLIEIDYTNIINRDNFSFKFINSFEEEVDIPLHRIKQIKKNNETIWARSIQ